MSQSQLLVNADMLGVEGGDLCKVWSGKFKGQCLIPYDCDETCRLEEGAIHGECDWTGTRGYACICIIGC
ncbi:hypothetical protein RDI58_017035 [Solanum bulbocastanum]|uniref:Knottins-like domain-containing protein n=1 Tax=Solanum bulbocastanum TaxID=147425 RepID=A0AAN8Y9K7_SOLBU